MTHFSYFLFSIPFILALLYSWYASISFGLTTQQYNLLNEIGDRILLVTAHPDDESVFFTPTIRFLLAHNKNVSLLTLTAGELCNGAPDQSLALKRLRELQNSCKKLGVCVHLTNIITYLSIFCLFRSQHRNFSSDLMQFHQRVLASRNLISI